MLLTVAIAFFAYAATAIIGPFALASLGLIDMPWLYSGAALAGMSGALLVAAALSAYRGRPSRSAARSAVVWGRRHIIDGDDLVVLRARSRREVLRVPLADVGHATWYIEVAAPYVDSICLWVAGTELEATEVGYGTKDRTQPLYAIPLTVIQRDENFRTDLQTFLRDGVAAGRIDCDVNLDTWEPLPTSPTFLD